MEKAKHDLREVLASRLLQHATITLECEPEDLVIEGNALDSGNPEWDREQEQWIRDQLSAGNEWAWCCAHVRARFKGFAGDDYLGACSYHSEADFRAEGGYFADMQRNACRDLADQLIAANDAYQSLL